MVSSYVAITQINQAKPSIKTDAVFDATYVGSSLSPIDEFIDNTNQLNVLYLTPGTPINVYLSTFVLLGYVSAVEGYIRAIVRQLVNVDEYIELLAHPKTITFGSAVHDNRTYLPDALLETFSLAGREGVVEALNTLLKVSLRKHDVPEELKRLLLEYNKICQVRHCCVHRFGKLGAHNAIQLGFAEHRQLIEKPVNLSVGDLDNIAEILRKFIKVLNNYICGYVLERTVKNKDDNGFPIYTSNWSWHYGRDRQRFLKYYNIFATRLDSVPTEDPKKIYKSLKDSR